MCAANSPKFIENIESVFTTSANKALNPGIRMCTARPTSSTTHKLNPMNVAARERLQTQYAIFARL